MHFMLNAFLDWLPWWTWYAVAAVAVVIFLPWLLPVWTALPSWLKWVLGGFALGEGAYLAGRNKGKADEDAAQKRRDQQAEQTRTNVDKRVDSETDEQRNKDLKPWLRD